MYCLDNIETMSGTKSEFSSLLFISGAEFLFENSIRGCVWLYGRLRWERLLSEAWPNKKRKILSEN
jgi:hypothetical protein